MSPKACLLFFLLVKFTILNGQSTDGDALFNVSTIHTVNIYFTQPSFWDSLTTYYALDKPMLGSVNINGTLMDSVGVQLKGNSSYNSMPGVKKSIKISFDEYISQKFDGLKTVNLNNGFKDPSFLREKLMNDFMNEHGIPAPRCTYADVYINGTHWGFYMMVEQVNKTFLTDRFGNNDGNLYKGDPHGDLRWLGSLEASYYPNYELKTNETVNDWSGLVQLVNVINNTTAAQFHDSLESAMVTDLAIRAWAANNLFVNLDSYLGSGHNYYIYDDYITNKFEWITWDVNEAFGNFNMGMTLSQIKNLDVLWLPSPATNRPLLNRMIQNVTYKNSYFNYLCQWIQNDFSLAALNDKIDSIANIIRPYVYADPNKQFSNANFDLNIDHDVMNYPGIKDFIDIRKTNVNNQLVSLGVSCSALSSEELNISNLNFNVFPNPFSDKAVLTANNGLSGNFQIIITDVLGNTVRTENIDIFPFTIRKSNLHAGLYFYEIKQNGKSIFTGKIMAE